MNIGPKDSLRIETDQPFKTEMSRSWKFQPNLGNMARVPDVVTFVFM